VNAAGTSFRQFRSVLAAIGFFLLTLGSASIGMGAAIALSGARFGTSGPARSAADAAVHNNDRHLEGRREAPVADSLC
jgi:hypothetical protein